MSAAINSNERRVDHNRQVVHLNRWTSPEAWATHNYLSDASWAFYADRDAAEMYRRSQLVPGSPEAIKQQELDDMMAWFAKYGCD